MAFMRLLHFLLLSFVILENYAQNTEDSKNNDNCDKDQEYTTIKWPFPAPNGQNVNYMPMMPMAVPVVQGPKGDRGAPGTCDQSQCKCDCPKVDNPRHSRRALRGPYQRNQPNNNEYYRGPQPQAIKMMGGKGQKGQKGVMGIMGLTGLPGPQGPAGPKGQKGESGNSVSRRYLPGVKGDRGNPGIRGFPGVAGLRGPQGPPGRPGKPGPPGRKGEQALPGRAGPPGKKGEQGKPGSPGTPGKSRSSEKRVAFTVAMTDDVGPVQLATPLKFRDVILNLGAAYNLITGIFTVPYNGTYVLSFNALSQYNKPVELTLLRNHRVITSIHSRETGGYAGAGNSIAIHLVEGDRLWIELSPGLYFVYGDNGRHTVFSGYLLYPD